MKLANIRASRARAERLVGSSPTSGTKKLKTKVVSKDKNLLAYIIGLALGDGNLSNPNGRAVRLRISCDAKYPKLIQRIQKALKDLLPDNKVQLVNRKANCVDVSSYSNKWPMLLGWNVGNKIEQKVRVPGWVQENNEYAKSCLKGLLET